MNFMNFDLEVVTESIGTKFGGHWTRLVLHRLLEGSLVAKRAVAPNL